MHLHWLLHQAYLLCLLLNDAWIGRPASIFSCFKWFHVHCRNVTAANILRQPSCCPPGKNNPCKCVRVLKVCRWYVITIPPSVLQVTVTHKYVWSLLSPTHLIVIFPVSMSNCTMIKKKKNRQTTLVCLLFIYPPHPPTFFQVTMIPAPTNALDLSLPLCYGSQWPQHQQMHWCTSVVCHWYPSRCPLGHNNHPGQQMHWTYPSLCNSELCDCCDTVTNYCWPDA